MTGQLPLSQQWKVLMVHRSLGQEKYVAVVGFVIAVVVVIVVVVEVVVFVIVVVSSLLLSLL